MKGKNKLTNKQSTAMGLGKVDNGKNIFEEERKERQKKNDNVIPR